MLFFSYKSPVFKAKLYKKSFSLKLYRMARMKEYFNYGILPKTILCNDETICNF